MIRVLFVEEVRILLGFLVSALWSAARDDIHLGKFIAAEMRSEDERLRLPFLPGQPFAVRYVQGRAQDGIGALIAGFALQFRKRKIVRRIKPREWIGVPVLFRFVALFLFLA